LNKSGEIDWNDFELLFDEIKKERGADSPEYRICEEAMLMVWKGLLSAAKGLDEFKPTPPDVTISIAEWDHIWENYNPKQMPIWQWEYLKYMFFLLDSSGDKFIDEHEYSHVMKIYGVSDSDSKAAFRKFAVDDNGKPINKVDYGFYVKRWREYWTSKEKNAPGNFLFGPNV